MSSGEEVSDEGRLLIGAVFTHEYAIEGAALCNPSIVLLADEAGSDRRYRRFVMSVRGIGEGHRSSIGFRTGTAGADGAVVMDAPGPYPVISEPTAGLHRRCVFHCKLDDLDDDHGNAAFVLDSLPDEFDRRAAARTIDGAPGRALHSTQHRDHRPPLGQRRPLVVSGRVRSDHHDLRAGASGRTPPPKRTGMEDARFVHFVDDDGSSTYYATYTAFDGTLINQHLLQTDDFRCFDVSPMAGAAARGKGLALFPRKVNGRYVALTRSDRESNSVAFSDDLRCWPTSVQIQVPEQPWDMLQLGNCGSPIETDGRMVGAHSRRRCDAHLFVGCHPARPRRPDDRARLLTGPDHASRTSGAGTGTCRTCSTPAGQSPSATTSSCRTASVTR